MNATQTANNNNNSSSSSLPFGLSTEEGRQALVLLLSGFGQAASTILAPFGWQHALECEGATPSQARKALEGLSKWGWCPNFLSAVAPTVSEDTWAVIKWAMNRSVDRGAAHAPYDAPSIGHPKGCDGLARTCGLLVPGIHLEIPEEISLGPTGYYARSRAWTLNEALLEWLDA